MNQPLAAGHQHGGWDGRDNAGAAVGSGGCYVDLRAGDRHLQGQAIRVC